MTNWKQKALDLEEELQDQHRQADNLRVEKRHLAEALYKLKNPEMTFTLYVYDDIREYVLYNVASFSGFTDCFSVFNAAGVQIARFTGVKHWRIVDIVETTNE